MEGGRQAAELDLLRRVEESARAYRLNDSSTKMMKERGWSLSYEFNSPVWRHPEKHFGKPANEHLAAAIELEHDLAAVEEFRKGKR